MQKYRCRLDESLCLVLPEVRPRSLVADPGEAVRSLAGFDSSHDFERTQIDIDFQSTTVVSLSQYRW